MIRILVDTEKERQELLVASEIIHFENIDTDFPGINFLAHLYIYPETILVSPEGVPDNGDQ